MNLLAAASTTPLWVVLGYLVLLLALGIYSSRFFKGTSRDYFVASRSIGSFLLLMSVFGTTMTGFALVGSTGQSFKQGIAVYGAMASWSGLVHSAMFFLVGIRLWAIGKRNGYVTQVQFFRNRFESPALGYVLFVLLVVLVIPYLLIGILSAGKFIQPTTAPMFDSGWLDGGIPPWLSGLVICGVVLSYVFLGGVRSAVWANTFQTLVFMLTAVVAFFMISKVIARDYAKKDDNLIQNIRHATEYVQSQDDARHLLVRGVHPDDRQDYQDALQRYQTKQDAYDKFKKKSKEEQAEDLEGWKEQLNTLMDPLADKYDSNKDGSYTEREFAAIPEKKQETLAFALIELWDANQEQMEKAVKAYPAISQKIKTLRQLRAKRVKRARQEDKIEPETEEEANRMFAGRNIVFVADLNPFAPVEPKEPKANISHLMFFSFLFIPLSVAMFPHVFQHWLTAKSAKSFRLPIIAHPICIAIVWLPCVLIGIWAAGLYAAGELTLAMIPGTKKPNSGAVLGSMVVQLVDNPWLLGLLMAGVLAAIMSSLDSQFVCLGTMFTNDIFLPFVDEHNYTDRQKVWVARIFTVAVVAVAYILSLALANSSVFNLGVWCFTGFTGLVPLVIAALYWKRTTVAGAFASIAVTAMLWLVFFQQSGWGVDKGYSVLEMKAVMPITLASAVALILVSLFTTPPTKETLRKFFPSNNHQMINNKQQSGRPQEQRSNPDRRQNYGNRNRRGSRPRRPDSGGQ